MDAVEAQPSGGIEGFSVQRVLGRGGVGAVYLADDPEGRTVALKVMALDLDPTRKARFEQEASIGAMLKHPDIIEVYGCGVQDSQGWISMEYLDGFELASAMLDEGFGVEDRVRVLARVARALHYAHENGVIHRDVKPSNVFMTRAGGVRLLDFGIARLAATKITKTGYIVGTPQYMSPEQISGVKIDVRADIFSLGVVAYELLSGKLPWNGENHTQIMMAVCSRPAPPLAEAIPPTRFPLTHDQLSHLHRIVHQALRQEPEQRFATARDFADALDHYLAGSHGQEPAVHSPPVDPAAVGKQRIEWAMARAARLQVEEEVWRIQPTSGEEPTMEEEREERSLVWYLLLLVFAVGIAVAAYLLMQTGWD